MGHRLAGLALALLTLAWGCTPERDQAPTLPTPLVPQASLAVSMNALISGTLVTHRGCLVLQLEPGGRPVLLIWPVGSSAARREDRLVVIDRTGSVMAEVGRPTVLGGGFVPRRQAEALVGAAVLERCTARGYWVVSPERPGA